MAEFNERERATRDVDPPTPQPSHPRVYGAVGKKGGACVIHQGGRGRMLFVILY